MAAPPAPRVPDEPKRVLRTLWHHDHAAYLVGGGIRDALLGRAETDWDVATDARPERLLELFPEARYENRFGTVTIAGVEVTTFRRDHIYGDHRRPDSVTFTQDVNEDLARRDFTVNAIAWGGPGGTDTTGKGRDAGWLDPTGGLADLASRTLRAVGDPDRRFDEDSLRLLRAARLAAQLGFEIEPQTRAAMSRSAHLVGWVSSERLGAELRRMVAANPPSRAVRIMAETGLLAGALPELALQRGIAQDKIPGHDLLDHSLAAADAAAQIDPPNQRLRLATLLHDIGKPRTMADGRFIGHDVEGATMAEELLTRLAFPRREAEMVARLVRHHMFNYAANWSAAAVRRFVRRVGRDIVDDLLSLRMADNVGSGRAADAGGLIELRSRVEAELAAEVPLSLSQLAIDGSDLMAHLALPPGPLVGELLERLLESVIADPARNSRDVLLADARAWTRPAPPREEGA